MTKLLLILAFVCTSCLSVFADEKDIELIDDIEDVEQSIYVPADSTAVETELDFLTEEDTTDIAPVDTILPLVAEPAEPLLAVDNSERLLHEADSLSYLTFNDPYKHMFLPIVFVKYHEVKEPTLAISSITDTIPTGDFNLPKEAEWLDKVLTDTKFQNYHIHRLIAEAPWLIHLNLDMLPEPPKQYEVKPDISKNILVVEERKVKLPVKAPDTNIKTRNWIHKFDAALHFSQAYLSENWYQGGSNNLNMITDVLYDLKLNEALHPNKLFQFTVQYKLAMNSAPDDTLRNYNINEDLFQVNAKFGLKATKNFYYSMNMQFRTQILQNFKTNTHDISASFLTPADLNVGVGMTYDRTNERKNFSFNASVSPLSYNMKICRANDKLDPTSYGIEEGKHIGHEIGSSGEFKLNWAITPNIVFSSRLFVFSDYSYLQGDLEAKLDFSINKFLSTQIFAHLRYDDSADINKHWRYWQFKEVLSFGLQYKFRM